jgi:uncharacterized protein with GYD domain
MIFVSLVKAAPGRAKEAMEALKGISSLLGGAKVLSCYITFGRYDAVCIWEAPDLSTANRTMRALVEKGLVTTETMVAQSPEEFLK